MRIRIMCTYGDRNCEVGEEVGRAIFDKLTGRTVEALPKEMIPETFLELQALWDEGKRNYFPVDFASRELVTEYAPSADVVFIPPLRGG